MIPDERIPRTTKASRYRGISYRRVIDEAKERISCVDLVDRYVGAGKMRRSGETWITNCVLPDHADRTPSFVVYPKTDSWWCFGCLRGGDCVELYRLLEGYSQRQAGTAAGMLLLSFGFQPPGRPESWFRKADRQRDLRTLMEEKRLEVFVRRLWKYCFLPVLAELETEAEREEMARALWPVLENKARVMLSERSA
jgi:hypothetical protein